MKIMASYCCEYCKAIFKDKKKCQVHENKEKAIQEINKKFPLVRDSRCRFANGEYSVKRNKEYVLKYRKALLDVAKRFNQATSYVPFTYAWYRWFDDSNSEFYGIVCRYNNFCLKCFREWGQPYYSNQCCHKETKCEK